MDKGFKIIENEKHIKKRGLVNKNVARSIMTIDLRTCNVGIIKTIHDIVNLILKHEET